MNEQDAISISHGIPGSSTVGELGFTPVPKFVTLELVDLAVAGVRLIGQSRVHELVFTGKTEFVWTGWKFDANFTRLEFAVFPVSKAHGCAFKPSELIAEHGGHATAHI